MKYLSNTIKMTLVVGILFFGLAVYSKADETSIGQKIQSFPGAVDSFITSEIDKTKEYQKIQWQNGKNQLANTIAKIKGFFIRQ